MDATQETLGRGIYRSVDAISIVLLTIVAAIVWGVVLRLPPRSESEGESRPTLGLVADTVIRRVDPTDSELIRHVRLRALATDPASFGSTHEREAAFPDEAWAEWASGDAEGDEMATLLAIRGSEPVGIVAAYRDENERNVFHVIGMWVTPEVRREGVGRRLLEEIESWILSCRGTVVQLSVTDAAAAAGRLYESAGYEADGDSAESRHTPGLIEVSLRKQLSD